MTIDLTTLAAASGGSALLGLIAAVLSYAATKKGGFSIFIGFMAFLIGPAIGLMI
ncbi:hypothetical protein ACFL0X_02640 [Nanoarchaeota archaeon]